MKRCHPAPRSRCALLVGIGLLLVAAGCKDKTTSAPPLLKPGGAAADAPPAASPPPPAAEPPFSPRLGAVLAFAVSVRAEPKPTAVENGRIHCGDVVQLKARAGDWYLVQLGEVEGYAHSAYLIELKPGQGLLPACEADHLGVQVRKDPPPIKLPAEPQANKWPAKKVLAQADKRPAPDAEPALSKGVVAPSPAAEKAAPPKPEEAAAPPKPEEAAAPPKPEEAAKASQAPRRPPQNLQLSTAGIKPAVAFPHLLHTKVTDCAKCHHPLNGGSGANKDKRCHDCHTPGGKGESAVSNKDAFHRVCRDCHNTLGKGPTTCSECHLKQ